MRIGIFILGIFFLTNVSLKAQLSVGPLFEVNSSKDVTLFSDIKIQDNGRKLPYYGSAVGLSMTMGRGTVFHFQPEILYSMLGSKYQIQDTMLNIHRNYVTANFLFDIGWGNDNIRVYGQPGLFASVLLSGDATRKYDGQTSYYSLESVNSISGGGMPIIGQFGFSFGAGVEKNIGPGRLQLNIRYNLNIVPHTYSYKYGSMQFYKAFSLGLAYVFELN